MHCNEVKYLPVAGTILSFSGTPEIKWEKIKYTSSCVFL